MEKRIDSEYIIRVENISKQFKEQKRNAGITEAVKSLFRREKKMITALDKTSLKVRKGEVIGLIGPNGAGKSTLIKIMTGVLFPSDGKMDIMGYVPWKDRIKYVQNIGVIFGQKSQLWWDIPAIDTFELYKDLYGIPEREFKSRLNYMIEELELTELVKKPVRQLSLGERMKCELILCLIHNPKIVFLDEPTIGLDLISRDKIRYFVKEFNKRYGTTFLITTHDMSDIENLCKRVVIINHGKIIYDGLLNEIRKKFANKKMIDCKFSEPVGKYFKFRGCEVVQKGDFQIVIELDLTKAKIKDIVDHLITKYGDIIEDIDIEQPPIEDIIKEIYKLKRSI